MITLSYADSYSGKETNRKSNQKIQNKQAQEFLKCFV